MVIGLFFFLSFLSSLPLLLPEEEDEEEEEGLGEFSPEGAMLASFSFFPLPYIQLLAFFNSLHTWRGSGRKRRRRRMGEEEGELRNAEAREEEEEGG